MNLVETDLSSPRHSQGEMRLDEFFRPCALAGESHQLRFIGLQILITEFLSAIHQFGTSIVFIIRTLRIVIDKPKVLFFII